MAFGTAWRFSPAQITTPVHLWHGELDNNVPVQNGRKLAETVLNCQATLLPDEGQLPFRSWADEILNSVTA